MRGEQSVCFDPIAAMTAAVQERLQIMLKYGFEGAGQREIHAVGGLKRPRSRHTVSEARESMRAAMRKLVSGSAM